MLKIVIAASALAIAGLLSISMAHASCQTNWMECTADSQLRIGSFELQAAEVMSSIIAARNTATKQLKAGAITADQAVKVQQMADEARYLYAQARAVCAADATGSCTGSSTKAQGLLDRARKVLK